MPPPTMVAPKSKKAEGDKPQLVDFGVRLGYGRSHYETLAGSGFTASQG